MNKMGKKIVNLQLEEGNKKKKRKEYKGIAEK